MLPVKTAGNKFWLRLEQPDGTEGMELAKWLQGLSPESLGKIVPHSKNVEPSLTENGLASFTVDHKGKKPVVIQPATDIENDESVHRKRQGKSTPLPDAGRSLLSPVFQSNREPTLSAYISFQSVVKASCHEVVGASFVGSSQSRLCLFAGCQGEIEAIGQEHKTPSVLSVGTSISAFAALENGITAFGTPSGEIRIFKLLNSVRLFISHPQTRERLN